MRCFPVFATVIWVLQASHGSPISIADDQITAAIDLGQKYGNPKTLWNKELKKTNRLKMSGYWSMSGSKYLSVYTPFSAVAIAAAQAKHQMRDFGPAQARELPGMDTLRVIVEISAVSADNIARINRQFGSGSTHMVIKIKDRTLQPTSKEQIGENYMLGPQLWHVARVGSVTAAHNQGAFDSGGVVYEFLYPIAELV